MNRDLEKIFQGINEKRNVSFHYDGTGFYRMVRPYYVFDYHKKRYLLGYSKDEDIIKTYKLDKIEKVELTSLHFDDIAGPISEYLNPKFFKHVEVELISDKNYNPPKKIGIRTDKPIEPDDKLTRIIEYYRDSLKQEQLMELNLAATNNQSEFYKLNKSLCESIISFDTTDFELDYRFKKNYSDWAARINKEPELSIFLGYPVLRIQGKQLPFMFFSMTYNEENNTVKLSNSNVFINGAFAEDIIELSSKEAAKIKEFIYTNKEGELPQLNPNFKSLISDYEIMDYGVLFLQSNGAATKGLLNELKRISQANISGFSNPISHLISGQAPEKTKKTIRENILSVVPYNESQKKVISDTSNDIILVQGPPGTGKTQTIVNLIANEVFKRHKVLVTSTNNKAVDNIYEKLKVSGIFNGVLRLGSKIKRTEAIEQLKNDLYGGDDFDRDLLSNAIMSSDEVNKKLRSLESQIIEIESTEKRGNEIEAALSIQRKAIIKRAINYKETLNQLNFKTYDSEQVIHFLQELNKLSIICETQDIERTKLVWKFLQWFGFKYDIHFIKKNTELLNSLNITLHRQEYLEFISEMNIEINNLISTLQYKLIYIEKQKIEKLLESLNKDRVYADISRLKKEKVHIDIAILNEIHKRNLSLLTEQDKLDIIEHFKDNETAFSKSSKETELLFNVFPVVLSTNLSIHSTAPFDYKFDMVIIDEASQCTIPSSIPAIYKAKRLVIVGDDKQLNPVVKINTFEDALNLHKVSLVDAGDKYSYAKNSTFDIIKKIIDKSSIYLLNEHYRCEPRIIQFSNAVFYENQLKIMTSKTDIPFTGVIGINVVGNPVYNNKGSKSAYNVVEVETIFEYIKEHTSEFKDKSIGIITPFRRQSSMLSDRKKQLAEEFNGEDLGVLFDSIEIGTVHTFQGDERDIIFFSAVITQDVNSRTIDWLNEQRNLINVAITRAKSTFIMVGDYAFIKTTNGIFSELVSYIENISGELETIKLNPLFGTFKNISSKPIEAFSLRSILNPGEELLYKELKTIVKSNFPRYELGVKVRVADVIFVEPELVGQEVFKYSLMSHFDFVLFDAENDTIPVLAIELDGKAHRDNEKSIKNDAMKDDICVKHGLKIIRIPTDKTNTTSDLIEKIKGSLK